jgi:hypothetical protein
MIRIILLSLFTWLSLITHASAQFSDLLIGEQSRKVVVVTPPPPGGICSTTPTTAVALGMTQQIYCADFSLSSYSTQTSPGYFNLTHGWFGCNGDTNQHEWYQTYIYVHSGGPFPPCSNFSPGTTDPSTGTTTLKIHWNAADCPSSCNSQANANTNAMQNGLWGGNDGGSGFWSMPTNYYYSIKWRASSAVSGSYNAADTIGLATYLFDVNSLHSGSFTSNELDPANWQADNNPCCNQYGFVRNWGNSSDPNQTIYASGSPDVIAAPHTFALVIRNNGSSGGSNGTACEFIDDSQVGSCLGIKPTTDQGNNYRGIAIHSMGNLPRSWDMYIYSIQVFTRAGCIWQSSECLGSASP